MESKVGAGLQEDGGIGYSEPATDRRKASREVNRGSGSGGVREESMRGESVGVEPKSTNVALRTYEQAIQRRGHRRTKGQR